MNKISERKVAVVTGGTSGIGRAVSLQLAKEGYRVLALYLRDRANADELTEMARQRDLQIETIRGDLTHPERFASIVEEIKAKTSQVDVLVHSAASGVHRASMELSPKHLSWTFEINVFAFHQLMTELRPMIPSGGRVIGVTSSGATRVIPFYSAVGASKGAMESLFRHYAQELAGQGIGTNLVCPGLVLTSAVEAFPDREARIRKTIEATPSGRLTTPDDVAGVVSFLCSPAAAQIVGQTIVVDGGKTLWS